MSEEAEKLGIEATDAAFDKVIEAELVLLETPAETVRDLAIKVVTVADEDFASEMMTSALAIDARRIANVEKLAA